MEVGGFWGLWGGTGEVVGTVYRMKTSFVSRLVVVRMMMVMMMVGETRRTGRVVGCDA